MSDPTAPFEGPEKLLEISFAPTASQLDGQGLRAIERGVWEEMLDIVRCKVLSVVNGKDFDAYLLSESSLFISHHKLILKTCGTTLNLFGLPKILEIASTHCGFDIVFRCFYSRKSFMFPERQSGPHRDWKEEIDYLDKLFTGRGAAYTVGKVNGDHWLLWLCSPPEHIPFPTTIGEEQDYTIEILMTKLATPARESFFYPPNLASLSPALRARSLSQTLGINSLFPLSMTTMDSYAFDPCGYSANALVAQGEQEGYLNIHVTPESEWSYASFESNVPLTECSTSAELEAEAFPDLQTLIQRVIHIFQPGHLSLTLFTSSTGSYRIEEAQRAFQLALNTKGYRRTDKINYEFDGYDLAFASFDLAFASFEMQSVGRS